MPNNRPPFGGLAPREVPIVGQKPTISFPCPHCSATVRLSIPTADIFNAARYSTVTIIYPESPERCPRCAAPFVPHAVQAVMGWGAQELVEEKGKIISLGKVVE